MRTGICGSLESNDCLIIVEENNKLEIVVESIVSDFFLEQIEDVIKNTLKEENIDSIKVFCNDRGALDYTIKSRLKTAIKRYKEGS